MNKDFFIIAGTMFAMGVGFALIAYKLGWQVGLGLLIVAYGNGYMREADQDEIRELLMEIKRKP